MANGVANDSGLGVRVCVNVGVRECVWVSSVLPFVFAFVAACVPFDRCLLEAARVPAAYSLGISGSQMRRMHAH